MRIVVLMKPVPDPASTGERLGPDGRLDRAAVPAVVNGNDEYALEAALKLVEAASGGEVILLVDGAGHRARDDAQGPRDGRHAAARSSRTRRSSGSCAVSTATRPRRGAQDPRVRPRRSPASTRPTAWPGVVRPAVAALAGLPLLSYAAKIEPDAAARTVRVRRISPTGYDVLEAPMPALITCTQALGEPRYPSLKGIMGARSKEITTLSARGPRSRRRRRSVARSPRRRSSGSRAAGGRAATRVIREAPDEAARQIVAFLAERRLI